MKTTLCTLLASLALLAGGGVARADKTVDGAATSQIQVGLKAGGILPEAFSTLNAGLSVGAEAEYVLPVPALKKHLLVGLGIDYSQPGASGSGSAQGLPETGSYTWDIAQREMGVAVLATYRLPYFGRLVPSLTIGPRMYFLESKETGSASGEAFGSQTETSTKFGGLVALAADYALGPGALIGELSLAGSSLDHKVTGSSSTAGFTLRVGYRVWLGKTSR